MEQILTKESIENYLQSKEKEGVKPSAISKYRNTLYSLKQWMNEDSAVSPRRLQEWRKHLEVSGYSKSTVQKYVSQVNNFLRFSGWENLCIPKPIRNNLTGKTFGYLTVLEATDKRIRNNMVWNCVCKCGKEVEVPAVWLLSGHTTSCGCLNVEILQHTNQYVEGTSLRQCMDDRIINTNSRSGYIGVQPKRDKWIAYINYKGIRYHLGTYQNIEDAVKARARAKEQIIEEAKKLYMEYEDSYSKMPGRPKKSKE